MAVSRQALINLNPKFSDATLFPDDKIEHWSKTAEIGLPAERFNGSLARAHKLYVAHQMAIHAHVTTGSAKEFAPVETVRIAGRGSTANRRRNYMVYRANGNLPKEFNTPDTEHVQGGAWNSTPFGQQLHQMRRF